jgi:tetraacyldisaccharide 4'-kinase
MVEGVASRMHGVIGASRAVEIIELPRGVRVLSVGSVSWGGDGKTPLAGHVARQLADRGIRVAVVTRSTGGRTPSAARVSPGPPADRRADVSSWGDEAVMLASCLEDVPVWSGPDRGESLLACLVDEPSVIVLDDGLSLHGVRKDIEIALLSSGQSCFRRIPAGPLRRPVTDTSRADIVGIHVGEAVVDLESEARRLLDLSASASHPWFAFRLEPVRATSTGPVHLAAGIARPERFEAAAREAGYEVAGRTWFPDHHVPDDSDLAELARRAGDSHARGVLVTPKDAPRFPAMIGTLPVLVLEVQLRLLAHEHVLLGAIDGILHPPERG